MKGQETWKQQMAKVREAEAKEAARRKKEHARYMKNHS